MKLEDKYALWLSAAYRYYVTYDSELPDAVWDSLGRELNAKWDEWEHPLKHLVNRDEMFSGYYIQWPEDYTP